MERMLVGGFLVTSRQYAQSQGFVEKISNSMIFLGKQNVAYMYFILF